MVKAVTRSIPVNIGDKVKADVSSPVTDILAKHIHVLYLLLYVHPRSGWLGGRTKMAFRAFARLR